MTVTRDKLRQELTHAEAEAWAALARYKFQMFGYWAAIWVHLNRVGEFKQPNPFREAVKLARDVRAAPKVPEEVRQPGLLLCELEHDGLPG